MPLYDVIIIGSGPAGLTAAIYSTRANLKTLVIAGAVAGGQLMITTDVENYPGFPKGVQGPELMELWREQAERFKAEFVDDNVSKVDFSKRPLKVWTSDGMHEGRSVIIATGANAKYLGLPNEERLKGRGVSACATCHGFFFKGLEVVVMGCPRRRPWTACSPPVTSTTSAIDRRSPRRVLAPWPRSTRNAGFSSPTPEGNEILKSIRPLGTKGPAHGANLPRRRAR